MRWKAGQRTDSAMLLLLAGREGAVIKLGELVMILELHRQGVSVSAIARHLGIDRKTVRTHITKGLTALAYAPTSERLVLAITRFRHAK
jgi:DNA-binding MarR family transcriptional regulator